MPLPARSRLPSGRGFTLIELMIVVAIIALLSAIAFPAYTSYIAKSRRADARGQLLQVAQFMQRFYSANDSYETDRANSPVMDKVPASIKRSPADGTALYQLDIPAASLNVSAYELRMVPVAGGAMAGDQCGTFTLTSTGVRGVRVNGAVGSAELRDTCWK
jgi:type IV pilus assembly protein PilE